GKDSLQPAPCERPSAFPGLLLRPEWHLGRVELRGGGSGRYRARADGLRPYREHEMIKLTLSMLLAPLCALAEPTARTVSAGSAVFATTPGNALTVTTNPNTVINWSSFSIGKDAAPKYVQPQGVPQLNQLPSNGLRLPIGAVILANHSMQPPVGLQMQALQP